MWPRELKLCAVQELLKKEVLSLEDLHRILGERPFITTEMRNIDKYRDAGVEPRVFSPTASIWKWIQSSQIGGGSKSGEDSEEEDADAEHPTMGKYRIAV
jgi:hypothetical protein